MRGVHHEMSLYLPLVKRRLYRYLFFTLSLPCAPRCSFACPWPVPYPVHTRPIPALYFAKSLPALYPVLGSPCLHIYCIPMHPNA